MKRVLTISFLLTLLLAGMAGAQTVMPQPYGTVMDSTGHAVSGGLVYVYQAGTTTLATTYSDATLTTPNANPIVADSAGRFVAYLASGQSYKFTYRTAAGALIKTVDNVQAIPASTGNLDVQGVAGEALSAGNVVYLSDGSGSKTAGKWYQADADNTYSSTLPTVGIVPAAIAANAAGTVRIAGSVTGLSGLVVGSTYYISATAGAMMASAPTNARLLGSADTSTSLVLQVNTAAATVPITALTGAWTSQAHAAGDFTGSGTITWTVEAADLDTFAYQLIGKTLLVSFNVNTTTVSGTGTALRIAVPASKTSNRAVGTTFRYSDNGTAGIGWVTVAANGTVMELSKADGGNWSAATNTTSVFGQIVIETK